MLKSLKLFLTAPIARAQFIAYVVISALLASAVAYAAQNNFLGTVFLADSTTPSQQLAIGSNGAASVQFASGGAGAFSAVASASITRPANTTTYTVATGWNTATSGSSYGTITGVCRSNGGFVLIPEIDIYSSANPTTKLQGSLWLFDTVVGTPVNDNATFNIASADFANLTGNSAGFPFTLVTNQAAGAANHGISLTGTTYHAHCASGNTSMYFLIQVTNAYVPANSEILTIKLHTLGAN
jgi:hypothetical protein